MEKLVLSTKTKYIKNENVKTVDFTLIFPMKYNERDKYKLRILKMFLGNYSKDFPTEKEFKKELAKHMILNLSMSSKLVGNILYIRFDLTIPKDKLIEGYDIENSFKFFVDTIYNPLVEEGHLDDVLFNREKEFMANRLLDSTRSIYGSSFNRLVELFDKNEVMFVHHDTNIKYLNDTNSKDTFDLYNDNVLNGKYISYVYGNFNEEKIENLLKKYLPHKNEDIVIDKDYYLVYKDGKSEYVEEMSKFNQTALYMTYSVKDFKEEDGDYLAMIGSFLGGASNDLIFKALRLDNDLVYSSNVSKYSYSGVIIIETYLQYKNVNKAMELIRNTIKSLRDENLIKVCKDRILKGVEVELLKANDGKYFIVENAIEEDLKLKPLEEMYEIYKNMKVEDIIKFLDRLEENLVFVYRGEKDEEK